MKNFDDLKKYCLSCKKCELSKTRKNVVFESGNRDAKMMLIGEAPGALEDETGYPFVGRSGKLLTQILTDHGIDRERDLYICNIVKCRPQKNRVPTEFEKQQCREYLDAQINFVKPKIVILCGMTAVKSMLNIDIPISKIRGQFFDGPNLSKMIPIFHPSYLLRNHSIKDGSPRFLTNCDIELIKKELDSL